MPKWNGSVTLVVLKNAVPRDEIGEFLRSGFMPPRSIILIYQDNKLPLSEAMWLFSCHLESLVWILHSCTEVARLSLHHIIEPQESLPFPFTAVIDNSFIPIPYREFNYSWRHGIFMLYDGMHFNLIDATITVKRYSSHHLIPNQIHC